MQFEGAKITEQGVTFGIIIVRPHILHNPGEQASMRQFGTSVFGPIPIILMAQDSRGIPTYYGRQDIVRFLSNIDPAQIPWNRYTLRAA
jgi:membrane glycosyltransferase